jgi:hypothetical protein
MTVACRDRIRFIGRPIAVAQPACFCSPLRRVISSISALESCCRRVSLWPRGGHLADRITRKVTLSGGAAGLWLAVDSKILSSKRIGISGTAFILDRQDTPQLRWIMRRLLAAIVMLLALRQHGMG